jgi:cytochrome d ubiquinol oxidase subunit I
MNGIALSQWQFAITSIYHFFFVPLTMGLSVIVALMQTIYFRTGDEEYKKMTKFWGTLFLINFAMGVVTGIVMEFQFGMNWSEYSRYVGDIFGSPLAIEALLAFFLESTFLGLWIFGWDKLGKKVHLASIWLVAIGTNLSAFWILMANSFMQHPVGFVEDNGRLILTHFTDLLTNPYVWGQFPHTVFSAFTTASFFVIGISAYHLFSKHDPDFYQKSFRLAAVFGVIAIFGVILVGHNQAQRMATLQPMKLAAMEALWESEDPASLSLLSIVDEENEEDIFSIRIPYGLSILVYNWPDGEVRGINDLQAEFEAQYGPGDYTPPITITYWSFRIMVALGFLMAFILLVIWYFFLRKKEIPVWILAILPISIAFPYLSNSFGWILTEMGRQPWVVYGQLRTQDAVSPMLLEHPGMVLTSLIGFTLLYGILMIVDVYLLAKYAKAGPVTVDQFQEISQIESPVH